MNAKVSIKIPLPSAIFDTPALLLFEAQLPKHYQNHLDFCLIDYKCAHAFLYAYKDNTATYNAYRREIERFLLWAWIIQKKSILSLQRADLEIYLKFCQKPPKEWIGFNRVPHYLDKNGARIPNSEWRPFVMSLSKAETKDGKIPDPKYYALSDKAFREIFTVLSSFYNFLIQEAYAEINPVQQIRQKSKFLRKRQGSPKIRRLSDLQWGYVITAAKTLAEHDAKYERSLFIMTALYSMYLRISELTATPRWTPKMNDFQKDRDGHWWFTTVGKGNKERQIAVSDQMLDALKKWRKHLGLSPTPSITDDTPLILKEKGNGPISSAYQIRKIVQHCFDMAASQMIQDGFAEDAISLKEATVHWLRHTGISDDVKRRPREHVRDDAGHSSSLITDKYIDVDLRERYRSAKNKPIEQ